MQIREKTQDTITIELMRDDCQNLATYCRVAGGSDECAGTVIPELYAGFFQLALNATEAEEYRWLNESRQARLKSGETQLAD